MAVNGGESHEGIDEVRRKHKLTFTLISDSDPRLADLYEVRCWPATASIHADGIVDRIQFRISHENRTDVRLNSYESVVMERI